VVFPSSSIAVKMIPHCIMPSVWCIEFSFIPLVSLRLAVIEKLLNFYSGNF
jgi:hypothetical protein